MKYLNVVLFLSLVSYTFGYSQIQSAEVIYKVKYTRKKIDTTTLRSKKVYWAISMVDKEMDFIEAKLKFKNNTSSFKAIEAMDIEGRRRFFRKRAKSQADLNSQFYLNIKEKKIIRQREFDGKRYNITSNFDLYKWKLLNETKKINNFLCYKATTIKTFKSRKGIVHLDVIAWYCPKLPIPIGPKNFVNLPGLVLQVKEGSKTYYATKITLNLKDDFKVDTPKKGKVVSEPEYTQIISGSYDKLLNTISH